MVVVCDTATVPLRDSAEVWVEAVSELFVPLECSPHPGAAFHGRLRAGSLGPVQLCGLEVSPHTIKRTPRLAANTRGDQYKLSLMLGGEALIVQDDREAVLRPGDFALYDCSRPYTFVTDHPFRMLVCVLPRDIIGFSPERVSAITATRIPGGDGIAWAMAPFLKRLADWRSATRFRRTDTGSSRASSTSWSRSVRRSWGRTPDRTRTHGPSCCCASAPTSTRIWAIRSSPRRRSPPRTSSPSDTCTSSSRRRASACHAGSGSAGWSAAARPL